MKKLTTLLGLFLITWNLHGQTCYTVNKVENKTENTDLSSKKFTFGVKQIKAGFAELRDENLPFEKSVFASAIKKSLENAIQKI